MDPRKPGQTVSADHAAPGYRGDIDGLRAIAVLAVLAYHAFPTVVPGGYVGVDVFFVISGFLITSIITAGVDRGAFTFRNFYARRIRRLFPSLVTVLLGCVAMGWFVLVPNGYATLGKHVLSAVAFLSNVTLWSESGYFDQAAQFKPLLHLWSLGIEEQFYLLWPPALLLAHRLRIRGFPLTVVLGCVSFVGGLWLLATRPSAAFFLPFPRFWELLVGAALAQQRSLRFASGAGAGALAELAAGLGLALITFSIFGFDDAVAFPGWRALLPTSGAALLLGSGTRTFVAREILSRRVLVAIGLISYPLYLWHWPLLAFARIEQAGEVSVLARWLLLSVSVFLAWATWHLIENPFRFGRLRPASVRILSAAMLATAVLGGVLVATKGFESRVDQIVQRYANYTYDFREDSRWGKCDFGSGPTGDFASECVDEDHGDGRPLVVLWGDSFAGQFYPGLRDVAGDRFRIAQFTRSGCRPVLKFGWPRCQQANESVLELIDETKPEYVILFSAWVFGGERSFEPSLEALEATISALKAAGVPRIIVVGPPPIWKEALPTLLVRLHAEKRFTVIPKRTHFGLVAGHRERDAMLSRMLASRSGVYHFSIFDALCDPKGCLTYLDDDPDILTAWDYGHFTRPAARYVAGLLAAQFDDFEPLAPAEAPTPTQ